MKEKKYSITVPASTSNLGTGFDSLGLALNRYIRIEAEESDVWQFYHQSPILQHLPNDETHLICRAAQFAALSCGRKAPKATVTVESNIPLARGLGSSGSAIVCGIELCDQMLQLGLNRQEKWELAREMEGHPDNVGASLFGGLVVTCGKEIVTFPVPDSIAFVAIVPEFELKTKQSRSVLPQTLPFRTAVQGSAAANVMVAAMLQNDWEKAGRLMAQDVFHEPYRTALVGDVPAIRRWAREAGAYGTALSGAGPTVISAVAREQALSLAEALQKRFPSEPCLLLFPDNKGTRSEEKIKTLSEH